MRFVAVHKAVRAVYHVLPGKFRGLVVRMLTPNYTLGAVILVRDEENRLLLVRKSKEKGWSLPGGLLNRRELPAVAAARELREETMIDVPADDLQPESPNAIINARTQQVDLIFTTTVDENEVDPRADGVELVQVAWYGIEQLPPLTIPTARLLATLGIGPYVEYIKPGQVHV